jgi:hypothetical protein
MKYKNKFSEHYDELLEGEYDCIDRIVLNAYYPKLLSGGGLRDWYRQLKPTGSGILQKEKYSFCTLSNW